MKIKESSPFAVVTGASSGIGFELAHCCAEAGFDLLIVADEPRIHEGAVELRQLGSSVVSVEADLATPSGVKAVLTATRGRPVDALLANAGHGLGRAFLDLSFDEIRRVIDTNVTGTLYLVHSIGQGMRTQGGGRILITGSIAGFIPGTYQAVYKGTKALLDSFSSALCAELTESGIIVSCLVPGTIEAYLSERIDMLGNRIVAVDKRQSAQELAKMGFDAMMSGAKGVVRLAQPVA